MNGFVTELEYLLDSSSLYEAAPIVFSNYAGAFSLSAYCLGADTVCIAPAEKHSTISAARRAVESTLRAWCLECRLTRQPFYFKFKFLRASASGDVEDQNEHQPEQPEFYPEDDGIPLHIIFKHYPPAPTIRLTAEFEAMWSRYERSHFDFGESLLAVAYFIFTLLRTNAGGLNQMSERFGADQKVLRKLSELSSTRGDMLTARKVGNARMQPLDSQESRWLDEAVRLLMLNFGYVSAGISPGRITMSDLPGLP